MRSHTEQSAQRLRAGVFLPPFLPLDLDPTLAIRRELDLVEFLDKLGYDEAWIGEHHSGGVELVNSPEIFIAAAAERTSRIQLGTGVISLPYHNPMMVADRMVQLDHQTRGRVMFGFGPGLLTSDASMLGIPAAEQRPRMAESLDIVLRLLDGDVVSVRTDHLTLNEAQLALAPYSRPRPHVAVASTITPSGGRLAGQYGLGMLCLAASSAAGFDVLDSNWTLANKVAAEHGKQMLRRDLRLVAPFHLAETRAQAIADVRAGFEKWADYVYHINPAGPAVLGLDSIEAIIERGSGAIGTPDDAVAVLEKYWQKTDGFGCMLNMGTNWANFEATKRSYELYVQYVMPKFEARQSWRLRSLNYVGAHREEFSAAGMGAAMQAIDAETNRQNGVPVGAGAR